MPLVLGLAAFGLIVGGFYYLAARQARGVDTARPDTTTDEVVSGLLAEVRKWQAEAAFWQAEVDRLRAAQPPDEA